MFMFGAPNLDYYVSSFGNSNYNANIKSYCKNEGFNLDYFKSLLSLVVRK